MDKQNRKSGFLRNSIIAFLVSILAVYNFTPLLSSADEEKKEKRVIVSMGDSYSAGEGMPPFYGQDSIAKIRDQDWLGHRSTTSWPGMLSVSGVGQMNQHKNDNWYFVASSGAETTHLFNSQEKKYTGDNLFGKESINPQLAILDKLDAPPDYITLTLGGNDAGFANILTDAVCSGTYYEPGKLASKINRTMDNLYADGGILDSLLRSYNAIYGKTGNSTTIIVAGYPKLLDPKGAPAIMFNREECALINDSVHIFNEEIRKLVEKCKQSGMNIEYVSVEEAFEGHGAYSSNPYLNPVIIGPQSEDLTLNPASAYSMHPNYLGALAYARCVQAAIDRIEKERGFDRLYATPTPTSTPTPTPSPTPKPTSTPKPKKKKVKKKKKPKVDPQS